MLASRNDKSPQILEQAAMGQSTGLSSAEVAGHESAVAEAMALSDADSFPALRSANGIMRLAADATEADRMAALGVDFSKYKEMSERETYPAIESHRNRELHIPVLKSLVSKHLGLKPEPTMLTHIVTTRCNYSCHFCSFADSLNAKTSELSLSEIEQAYATIGNSLNTIVYSGGETTLNRQLPEIIEAAYRLTSVKSVYIISNAWKPALIFQLTHRIMQRCPGLHLTWSLSIEGPKPVNNATRHTKLPGWDAWQNTVDTAEGLKRMRQTFGYRELDVQMCTVCSPSNAHMMMDWYAMVRDVLQPDKWNLNLMRRSVQMSESQLPSFDQRRQLRSLEPFEQSYLEVTEQVRKDVFSGKLRFLYHTENPLDGAVKSALDLLSQEENRRVVLDDRAPGERLFCCQAGSYGAFIGSEGEVSGCEEFAMNPHENKTFGNLRDPRVKGDFKKIWHSRAARQYRKLVDKAPECRGCTLESQKNYPSILVSFKSIAQALRLARKIPV